MKLVCKTQPLSEPLDVSDVEGQIRVTDLAEERLVIERMIKAVRERAEEITRRALINQEWELTLDGFPSGRTAINLPLPPLQSITSITYTDPSGATQVMNPATYRVLLAGEPGGVIPLYGLSWPVAINDVDSVVIKFVCGFGADNSKIPDSILQWMLINIANLYENRESAGVAMGRSTVFDISATICDGLIESKRMYRL
jgi:uncharacterized phiE125 gp8 family phage protein